MAGITRTEGSVTVESAIVSACQGKSSRARTMSVMVHQVAINDNVAKLVQGRLIEVPLSALGYVGSCPACIDPVRVVKIHSTIDHRNEGSICWLIGRCVVLVRPRRPSIEGIDIVQMPITSERKWVSRVVP